MLSIKSIPVPGYEKVISVTDPQIPLTGFIALHNCSLGPALGGLRIYPYKSEDDALTDALRLAKAMTYKSALCETGLGGGKSVIIADPKASVKELLLAFAEGINFLDGSYIAAEDIGTSVEDMLILKTKTPYVAALPSRSSSGDPSRFTAWGIFHGLSAVAETLWKTGSIRGKTVAIQGLGHVGSKLADLLFWEEANLILTDSDQQRTKDLAALYGAIAMEPDDIYAAEADIFAPCAIGGVINPGTISRMKCRAVAGSANNQLLRDEDGILLQEKNILYAPDYVINSGGLINAAAEFEPGGYHPKTSRERVKHIYDTLVLIFKLSKEQNKPTSQVADELAEYKLSHGIGRRRTPICFTK